MTTKSSIADRKASLNRATEKYKKAIENQVGDLKANAGKIGKNALIIGGTLVAGYLIVRMLVGKDKTTKLSFEKEERNLPAAPVKRESAIVSLIKQQIALFLIAIAKEKLLQVIEQLRKNDTQRT
ncbi:hypothetical protein QNI19_34790 [Cytophagaceae bacterium DM2B3-1]|uniref:Uncharacterized protein n=1 Tax=Xanthocytophaga flava TaxID=3048013 RepID=A0ABT7CWQ2_9BACT|nr:hypothetical protein [Xanthocytophaga flavus]MDJ1470945.1 hypothetical protein [Xanthocytophaga flavus]MDJ1498162.1 hypothetical protein [Xanthocytophaga flavus]